MHLNTFQFVGHHEILNVKIMIEFLITSFSS